MSSFNNKKIIVTTTDIEIIKQLSTKLTANENSKIQKKIQILIKKHFLFFLSIFFVFCLIALFLRWPGTFRELIAKNMFLISVLFMRIQ